jgi:outer membrane protein assembly factor BamB
LALFPVLPAWNTAVNAEVSAPPAYSTNRVFIPLEGERVVAYNVETGAIEWTTDGSSAVAPATAGDLVFLAEPHHVSALRQSDGALVWRVQVSAGLATPLSASNGWLVGADSSGTLLSFRAADGALMWTRDLGASLHASPTLAADRIYAALADGRVVALDVLTGSERWSRRLGGPPNDIVAATDRVYVGSDDNFFYCLEADDGAVSWRWRTGGDVIGAPVLDGKRVYFVSKDNTLRALDRRSGAQRWKRSLPGRPTRSVVKAGGVLLVSGLSPRVAVFNLTDGTPAGDIVSPGELAGVPHVIETRGLPQVVLVTRDISTGARVLGFRRTIDPPMNTPLPILPGAITIAPPGTPGDPTMKPNANASSPGGTPPAALTPAARPRR